MWNEGYKGEGQIFRYHAHSHILVLLLTLQRRQMINQKGILFALSFIPTWPYVQMYNIINLQDGKTALDIAVKKGHTDVIDVLKTHQSKVRCAHVPP